MSILTIGLLVCILIPVLIVAFRLFTELIPVLYFGAIYVPSSENRVKTMVALAAIKKGERVIDLGSGDGRLVIAAAQAGARAVGVDVHKKMNKIARKNIRLEGLQDSITIREENMWKTDLSHYDVIFIYGIPYIMHRMTRKIRKEAKNGSRVISNCYPLSGWRPTAVQNNVYYYKCP